MLTTGIQSKELKLLEVVRILGEYLIHEDPKIRKNGRPIRGKADIALGCLSGVIMSFPSRTMNIQEVDVMTTFYCDRLEDEISTKENIEGLSALQKMPGFGEDEVTQVCSGYAR
jgi:DNA repair/transcription protein MET18/MMS19